MASRLRLRISLVLASLVLAGCGTLVARTPPCEAWLRPYRGVQNDAYHLQQTRHARTGAGGMAGVAGIGILLDKLVTICDLPLSFVLDTALLPFTLLGLAFDVWLPGEHPPGEPSVE